MKTQVTVFLCAVLATATSSRANYCPCWWWWCWCSCPGVAARWRGGAQCARVKKKFYQKVKKKCFLIFWPKKYFFLTKKSKKKIFTKKSIFFHFLTKKNNKFFDQKIKKHFFDQNINFFFSCFERFLFTDMFYRVCSSHCTSLGGRGLVL